MSQPRSGPHSTGGSTIRRIDLEPLLALGDLGPASVDVDRVEGILHGLAQVAVDVVRGAEAASLTLFGADGALATRVSTSTMAEQLDALQYDAQEGPRLEAATAKEWTAVLVADLQDESRWTNLRWSRCRRGGTVGAVGELVRWSTSGCGGCGRSPVTPACAHRSSWRANRMWSQTQEPIRAPLRIRW